MAPPTKRLGYFFAVMFSFVAYVNTTIEFVYKLNGKNSEKKKLSMLAYMSNNAKCVVYEEHMFYSNM